MIVLDTSVLSRVFRRGRTGPEERRLQARVQDLLTGDVDLAVPGLVLMEVLSGIRDAAQFAALERRFVTGFTILLATTADHVEAARLRNRCLAKGLNASGPDCLIAAQVIAGGHELFAVDRDLQQVARHAPLRLFPDPAA